MGFPRIPGALVVALSVGCTSDAPPSAVPCTFELNLPRTLLDADLGCPEAPTRVLCRGRLGASSLSPVEIRARYRPDGRLHGLLEIDPRLGPAEWGELAYEGDRLAGYGYDHAGRLWRTGSEGIERTFFYDAQNRLVRIEDPTGYHRETTFVWDEDSNLVSMSTRLADAERPLLRQTFELDEEGLLVRHVVDYGGGEVEEHDYEYVDGDLVRAPGETFAYVDAPYDIPVANAGARSLLRTWFLSAAQMDLFLRTGHPEHPWRVYLGDHPAGFVAAYPEYRPRHRLAAAYVETEEGISLAWSDNEVTFRDVADCQAP